MPYQALNGGYKMNKFIAIITFTLFTNSLFADDEKLLGATMKEYWSAWTAKDLGKAVTYMAPQDLEKGKRALLPVFLQAQTNEAQDIQKITDVFFGEVKRAARKELSKEKVFIGLNKIVYVFMGEAIDTLAKSSIRVSAITPDGEGRAIIRYSIVLDGEILQKILNELLSTQENGISVTKRSLLQLLENLIVS